MNLKGAGEIIMFFPFIFIIIVIGVGIVLGANSFYSNGSDVRIKEANLLLSTVEECFSREDFFAEDFDIFKCGLKREVLEENYLIYIKHPEGKEFILGVRDFTNQCYFDAAKSNHDYPLCTNVTFIKDGVSFQIVTGSNQKARNILT